MTGGAEQEPGRTGPTAGPTAEGDHARKNCAPGSGSGNSCVLIVIVTNDDAGAFPLLRGIGSATPREPCPGITARAASPTSRWRSASSPGMPTYGGGLGVLAGDTLRSRADLGVDIVGVTLVHRHGYFRQTLDADGSQTEAPAPWRPEDFARRRRRDGHRRGPGTAGAAPPGNSTSRAAPGTWCRLSCSTPIGPRTAPVDRTLTDDLYGGDARLPALPGDRARHGRRARAARARLQRARDLPPERRARGARSTLELLREACAPATGRWDAETPCASAACSRRTRRCPRATTSSDSSWCSTCWRPRARRYERSSPSSPGANG